MIILSAWDNAELTKVENNSNNNPNKYIPSIMVGIPYRNELTVNFLKSFYTLKFPPIFDACFEGGSRPLDLSRNIIVSMALKNSFEYLFFLDSDIVVFDSDIVNKLLHKKEMIVAATYFSRARPNIVVGTGQNGKMVMKNDVDGSLITMDSVGMGSTLIHMNVFHKIGENRKWRCINSHKNENLVYEVNYEKALENNFTCPECNGLLVAKFFDYTHGKFSGYEDDEDGYPLYIGSEDYYFCNLAKRFGYTPKLATDLIVHHEGKWLIGLEGFATTSVGGGEV